MKTIKTWLTTIAMLLCCITANAHDFEMNGIYYYISSSTNLTLSVTYKGNSYSNYANEYTGEVTIPSQVYYNNKWYTVTRIRTEAFKECVNLTSVNIQGGVTYIEPNAFEGCTSLNTVTLNNELTTIGYYAFLGCTSLKSITFPENLLSINFLAFSENTSLESIVISKNLKTIDPTAFYYCPELKSIRVDTENEFFDSRNNCNAIIETATNQLILGCKNTVIPNSVVSIGDYAFSFSSISSISIPENCSTIGSGAFQGCSLLCSVSIPSNVNELPSSCFEGCVSLTEVSLPNGLTKIGNETFMGCTALSEIRIPDNVTSIGQSAFEGCSSITAVNLPNKIEQILSNAFKGCSSLNSINLPNSIRKIDYGVFLNCSNLNSISIPSSVEYIDGYAFENTGWFKKQANGILYLDNCLIGYKGNKLQGDLSIKDGTRLIASYAFRECSDLTSITIPNTVENIGSYAFSNCSGLLSVNIPNSITSIEYGTFYRCSGLVSVNLANTITSIGSSAFEHCSNLKSIAIPTSVTEIGSLAFAYCSNLESITIPNSITSIGQQTFYDCSNLVSVNIPSSVTHIDGSAFSGCNKITEVICQNTTPPSAYSVVFKDIPTTSVLYVPIGSRSAYANHTYWKNFSNIVEQETFVNSYIVTYMLDGEIYKTETVAYGTKITPIEKPTKTGHSFIGWNEMPEIMPAKDITVYGTFVPNKYIVTFKVGDEVVASESLEYGTNIVVPDAPEKEGYTFEGWGDVDTTVPANDVTYEGHYSVNTYQLIYEVDGEIVQVIDADYGSTITLIDEPEKVGHSFSGWSEVPMTMPARNLTISGTFTINEYLVTFMANDVVISSESLVYGATIIAPNAPELEDYVFVEWDDLLETVPAYDVEFTAVYNQVNMRIKDGIASFSQDVDVKFDKIYYTRTFKNTNWQALYVPFEIPVTADFLEDYDVAYFNDIHSYDEYVGDKENGFYGSDGVIDRMDMEVLKVQEGTTLNANYPYLIRAKNEEALNMNIKVEDATLYKTGETTVSCSSVFMRFDVTGIYTTQTAGELKGEFDVYAMSGGGWKQALSESQQLKPFRLYLKLTSIDGSPVKVAQSAMKAIRIRVDGEDETTEIENAELMMNNSELIFDLQGRRVENPGKGIYIVNGKKTVIK